MEVYILRYGGEQLIRSFFIGEDRIKDLRVARKAKKTCPISQGTVDGDLMVLDLLGAGNNQLVLDLEELNTMDSSGIGLLTRSLTNAKQHGGSLKLVNPSKFVVQTLKLVGILNLFEVFQDTAAAVASYQ